MTTQQDEASDAWKERGKSDAGSNESPDQPTYCVNCTQMRDKLFRDKPLPECRSQHPAILKMNWVTGKPEIRPCSGVNLYGQCPGYDPIAREGENEQSANARVSSR